MQRNIKGKGGKHLGEVNVLVEGPIGGAIVVFAVVVVGARHLHPPRLPFLRWFEEGARSEKMEGKTSTLLATALAVPAHIRCS